MAPFGQRFIQDASVRLYFFIVIGSVCLGPILLVYLMFTNLFFITLLYFVWYFYELDICNKGGRKLRPFKNLFLFRHIRDYFSIKLIKTCDIPADGNYIFGSHPHGMHPFGTIINFITETTEFSKTFPGLMPYLTVWKYSFLGPVWREILNFTGSCSASERSIKYLLNKEKKGQAVVIIIGGVEETHLARPGIYKLFLKSRKGFARIALETGTSLVPVFNFGENETLDYSFKLINRTNINTVVGKPINVQKIDKPTREQISELHDIYVTELTKLFEENKAKYLSDPNISLEIV